MLDPNDPFVISARRGREPIAEPLIDGDVITTDYEAQLLEEIWTAPEPEEDSPITAVE